MSKNSLRDSGKGIDTKLALIGLIGLSPIPVVGEICGTYFFKKILNETPLPHEGAQGWILAAAVTGLTRLGLYGGFYKRMADYLLN